tara:strand:+ start:367 stop:816 length:450 start_codon:yes stop_codon:yes gene_type:complete
MVKNFEYIAKLETALKNEFNEEQTRQLYHFSQYLQKKLIVDGYEIEPHLQNIKKGINLEKTLANIYDSFLIPVNTFFSSGKDRTLSELAKKADELANTLLELTGEKKLEDIKLDELAAYSLDTHKKALMLLTFNKINDYIGTELLEKIA